MRACGQRIRSLAACGLAAAAILICGLPAHGQASRIGGAGGSSGGSSMGSSGFGGGGGSGGGGSSGSSSSLGSSNATFSFVGGSSSSFVGSTSGSSTFAGASGTGGFGGSSGTFSGSSGSGSYSSGGGSNGPSLSSGVSNMNMLASSFANPLASGLGTSSGTTSSAYGVPLYSQLVTNPGKLIGTNGSSAGGGLIGSSGTAGFGGTRAGMSGGSGTSGYGSTSGAGQYGIFALPYSVAATERYPVPAGMNTAHAQPGTAPPAAVVPRVALTPAKLTALPARVQTDLLGLISRSDNVSAATRGGITMGYDAGGNVVLRGTVASPAEARALESILRYAPGVTGVHNEMTLKGP